ncbi:hypothetical protein AAFC00_003773 [Neodothiora populina]|uniref:Histone-lysine N-methyltransferase, H3 lysine-4 specific n=1 Tax=Neodothiora populina TaxID=2781224 RepID=A0ABR3PFC6_9PEZI
MSRSNPRGAEASVHLPPSDSDARDSGSLLDGMGSASSLASNSSSVFSANAQAVRSNGNLSSATPLTHPDSSPLKPLSPYPAAKSSRQNPLDTQSPHAFAGTETPVGAPDQLTPPPSDRPQPRPPQGQSKGYRAVYDPELDNKLSKEEKKRGGRLYKSREFGTEPFEPDPPPDPRLVMVGYTSGNCVPKTAQSKTKLRIAPYVLKPYPFDNKHTVGPGPAKQIVVQGFDPFTPAAQLKAFFSSYGEIAELRNQTDPATGSFLGICLIRYRDSKPIRGPSIPGASAAKRAEKEANGERIGTSHIRVERDREGRKCKRHVETVLRRQRREMEIEQAKHVPLPPPVVPVSEPAPSSLPTPTGDSPAPPPNAPKGPAARAGAKPPDGPKVAAPRPSVPSGVESELVLSNIKRKPYLFISEKNVPVLSTTIPHLKKRLKAFDWREVRADKTGYYIIFEDSKRGEDEAVRCFKEMNGGAMFTYKMTMECQQYGNPDYERSPSPETQANESKRREEFERLQKDEEQDYEEEKRQRALHLDPVRGALDQLRLELRNKVMDDIKNKVTIPTLYDCLDPARHSAKRRKLDLPDPSDNESKAPALLINQAAERGGPRANRGQRDRPLRPHDPNSQRGRREPANAYIDERRARRAPPKPHARPLHFKLQQMYAADDDDSDDERRTSVTRDTEDQESRPLSRASRTSTPFGDTESVAESVTPRNKRKLEHKESAWEAPEEEQEEFDVFHKQLLGDVLRKEPEGMARGELELVISTLPRHSRFSQRCRGEQIRRIQSKNNDELFKTNGEETDGTPAPAVTITTADGFKGEQDKMDIDKPTKEKSKKKRKTKKQIFEEREALKKAAEAVANSQIIEDEAITQIEEREKELDDVEEIADEPAKPQVEWAVSADKPRPTVEDDLDMILDIDGWQALLKDDEDLQCLRKALEGASTANIGDPKIWAWQQKEIKALNTGGVRGPVHTEAAKVQGYYVPNSTGSARTEGVKKILESEKSKYLPHRIKVQRAREEREAQAKENPVVAAEKAKQEAAANKFASNATSRSNRANNRRLVNDINLQKQNLSTTGVETDAIRFNQLKKRKKLVKFDRSAIHGWGLYAMENIAYNDMIIEYVGEKVRQKVADLREEKYDKQGIGSSYLFRMVDDEIVDATKKGGIARFINHSCAPNCTAKIIKVEGTRRIVIYAMKDIAKNEELTYDYKFEREYGSTDRIPCLCGTTACKGFLN